MSLDVAMLFAALVLAVLAIGGLIVLWQIR